jgi:hypothetical protein
MRLSSSARPGLAYKKILPALQEMIKRGALTVQESTPLRHVRARRLGSCTGGSNRAA